MTGRADVLRLPHRAPLDGDGRRAAAVRLAERWRPYRAYAVQHLWATLAP